MWLCSRSMCADARGGAELEIADDGDPYFALRAGDGGSSRSQLVALHENQRGEITTTSSTTGALKTGGGKPSQGYPCIAFSHTAGIDVQASASASPTIKAGHDTMPSVAYEASRGIAQSLTANYGKQPDNSDTNLGPTLAHTDTVVRRLTELECERLQGFPDGWTGGQSGSARYRQLGNAVAVPVVEWVARRLIAVDEEMSDVE